jgi:hypothetical protein
MLADVFEGFWACVDAQRGHSIDCGRRAIASIKPAR